VSGTAPGSRRANVRRPMIGTSWKMNLLPSTAPAWLTVVRDATAHLADREIFVIPPFPAIPAAQSVLAGSHVRWGGQDVHADDAGAHTGDVSAPMLADLGCTIAEIGHSERRRDHGETDEVIAGKVRAALRWRLTPLLCVGEGRPGPVEPAIAFVSGQLDAALGGLTSDALTSVVVAYEPVWAIGEGARAADLGHVGAIHAAIRGWLDDRGAPDARVLYGGSVDPRNAPGLLATPSVDGVFVGRSALDPEAFVAIATLPLPAREDGT
jgi:triosephosphate isomerase (TIM)